MTHRPADTAVPRGRIFYDADCALCRGLVDRHGAALARRGYVFEPLEEAIASERYAVPAEEFRREMKLLRRDGRWVGGADAVLELARASAWLRPLAWILSLPGLRAIARSVYRRVAARRSCKAGTCAIERSPPADRWWPIVVLPAAALALGGVVPRWAHLACIAIAIWLGAKWLTYRDARGARSTAPAARRAGYLLAWPGMNAREFLAAPRVAAGRAGEWVEAATKTALGALLVALAASPTAAGLDAPLARGWTALAGMLLFFHFGAFHILSLLWRAAGVDARPIMRRPIASRSPSDFWSRRWNVAFHELTTTYLFRPLARRTGPRAALALSFLVSGLVHELAITVPAGAGYGGPTLFFAAQGLAVLVERSRLGRRLGLDDGLRGRLWMAAALVAPLGLLVPPAVIERVVLPMLGVLRGG